MKWLDSSVVERRAYIYIRRLCLGEVDTRPTVLDLVSKLAKPKT